MLYKPDIFLIKEIEGCKDRDFGKHTVKVFKVTLVHLDTLPAKSFCNLFQASGQPAGLSSLRSFYA